jgi:hypothetical protein
MDERSSAIVIPGLDPGIPGAGRVKPGHDEEVAAR